jgi:hypothetical protein
VRPRVRAQQPAPANTNQLRSRLPPSTPAALPAPTSSHTTSSPPLLNLLPKKPARYTFEYPPEWKSEVPSKVEKGTQGVDGRVVNPKGKDQRAFVITLGRAGEDNARFQLTDLDSTFAGFAGADYYLQVGWARESVGCGGVFV